MLHLILFIEQSGISLKQYYGFVNAYRKDKLTLTRYGEGTIDLKLYLIQKYNVEGGICFANTLVREALKINHPLF